MAENNSSVSSLSVEEIDIIRNFEIKENLPLRGRVSGLSYVFPEMREPIDLYVKGSLAVLFNAKFFLSSVETRSLIENNFLDVEPELGDVILNSSFANKILDAYVPIFNYNKGLAVNLIEWGHIESKSPLSLLDDSNLLKKVHNRMFSEQYLKDVFDKFWDVYEFSVRKIPRGELFMGYGSHFIKLYNAMNSLSSKKFDTVALPPKLNFANNVELDEGLSIFKEQYHDVLLDRKLNKYF